MEATLRNAVISGVLLGIVAGLVVWYLERFEMERMYAEINSTLGKHAAFDDYLKERGEFNGGDN
jgi:hypothetical protein